VTDHDVPLDEADVASDPLEQFRRWYAEAATVVRLPEAAAVATVDESGRPSLRMVLVKEADEHGFTFFTNYDSRKGRELQNHPFAALLFYWDALGRQVRIEGPVEPVSAAESDAYFATRPRGSQISAAVSEQSRPIESRAALEARVAQLASALSGGEVARPERWGGFRVRPQSYEFWQNRDDRLHDRLRFELDGAGRARAAGASPAGGPAPGGRARWAMQRLQP